MSTVEIAQIVAAVFIVLGAAFCVVSAIGVVRLPDVYTRMHAASKAGVVGAGLIFVGAAIVSFDPAVAMRSALGILFLLLTTPVSAHLLARAAWQSGVKPDSATNISYLPDR